MDYSANSNQILEEEQMTDFEPVFDKNAPDNTTIRADNSFQSKTFKNIREMVSIFLLFQVMLLQIKNQH